MKVIRNAEIQFEAASHENPASPGVLKKVLLAKDGFRRGHVQMLNWARLPAGRSFCAHYHEDMQEIFVIVQGGVSMEVDGQIAKLGPGDAIVIEPHEIHAMSNDSDQEDAQYLVFGISSEEGGKTVVVEP